MSKEIDMTKPVLVTGGNGYLASWVIKKFLDKGIEVRATVRDKSNIEKMNHLVKLNNEHNDRITFFEADLLKEGSFDEAVKGCELVFHIASPFKIFGIKDPIKELVNPALKGTENVLSSVNISESVKRVIPTSITASIHGDAIEAETDTLDEQFWNTTSSEKYLPYSYSRKIAEEIAWKIAKAQSQWDLITINPGFILGPSLSKTVDSFSINLMRSLLIGKNKSGVPEFAFPVVDVRDAADAHILSAFTGLAKGKIYHHIRRVSLLFGNC